ncbi:MAG TPA: 16S rRNA (guanine(527)-N(7))-methyltransferase RsmG [Syntrophobacteraceae bacterium]|nr:16S rRNA (guanine(527)-N(7))-methyltransferase RsmG [Syntrophobacteraceae bacterium]
MPPGIEAMEALLNRSGIHLSPPQLRQLWRYHLLLREYNTPLNLTRIHNFENMVLKLYVDSILPAMMLQLPSPLLDLGSGPGMPGIPLKIARPDIEVWLAESRQNRVAFLETVCNRLELPGIRVIGQGIHSSFREPVGAVITRAVESMGNTLKRIHGCLQKQGLVIFMKGPNCDVEMAEVSEQHSQEYLLVEDHSYYIPHTSHSRRLVVYRRLTEAGSERETITMNPRQGPVIESEHNDTFKDLKKILASRGIKKQNRAIVSGEKVVREILRDFPERCETWVRCQEDQPPPVGVAEHLVQVHLSSGLFQQLDVLGTHSSLLVIGVHPMEPWEPAEGFLPGCNLLVPFQDPENVGAVIRSAAAFGAAQIILLAESAHPYHPKAIRASGGAMLRVRLRQGPSLHDLTPDLPIMALSAGGAELAGVVFPGSFGLLPGLEGPGLPEGWRGNAVGIALQGGVESLNAATATAIVLHAWSRRKQ